MRLFGGTVRGWFYRKIMRLAHRYHWHYAPPFYPEGDTELWCQWCGFRQTIKRQKYETIQGEGMERCESVERSEP